ncbi:hypothetical protein F4808DRAFT_456759 [Astrocystis sublimbata]|nr:hypothetical protein F4808DRAFT_456759 [Astrocystis sublimbata]
MSDINADSIVKAPVDVEETKAPNTTDSLPPITKEPAATAEASMVPSVPVEATAADADAPAAPSSETPAKTEAPPAAEALEETSKENESSKPDVPAAQPEKLSDSTSTPAPELGSTNSETVASGVTPAGAKDKVLESPKPVSAEKDSEGNSVEKPEEEAPTAVPGAEAAAVPPTESAPVENGNIAAGKKRKADKIEQSTGAEAKNSNGLEAKSSNGDSEPAKKKVKTNGTGANGTARKPGRPKKSEKKFVAPAGRTARVTRSQRAAEEAK